MSSIQGYSPQFDMAEPSPTYASFTNDPVPFNPSRPPEERTRHNVTEPMDQPSNSTHFLKKMDERLDKLGLCPETISGRYAMYAAAVGGAIGFVAGAAVAGVGATAGAGVGVAVGAGVGYGVGRVRESYLHLKDPNNIEPTFLKKMQAALTPPARRWQGGEAIAPDRKMSVKEGFKAVVGLAVGVTAVSNPVSATIIGVASFFSLGVATLTYVLDKCQSNDPADGAEEVDEAVIANPHAPRVDLNDDNRVDNRDGLIENPEDVLLEASDDISLDSVELMDNLNKMLSKPSDNTGSFSGEDMSNKDNKPMDGDDDSVISALTDVPYSHDCTPSSSAHVGAASKGAAVGSKQDSELQLSDLQEVSDGSLDYADEISSVKA